MYVSVSANSAPSSRAVENLQMKGPREPSRDLSRKAIGSQDGRSPVDLRIAEANTGGLTIPPSLAGATQDTAPLDVYTFVTPQALGYNSVRRLKDQPAGEAGPRHPLKPVARSLSVEGT